MPAAAFTARPNLTVRPRSAADPMLAEEHLAREGDGGDPTAPPVAGGAV